MTVHTVFSTDGSLYQRWQADLLAYTHRKANQPGPLTWLYSASDPPPAFDGQVFQTRAFSPHPVTNDHYPPYNRIGALSEWLAQSPPEEETLLLLDPDCVFITACDETVDRGHPIAHPILSMDVFNESHPELLKRYGYRADQLQGVGVPMLIHRDDLKALMPLYMEKTEVLRADPECREEIGWMSDMWGWAFAAADLGLRHERRELSRWQMDHVTDLPFIHYCYSSASAQTDWHWDKRRYEPWTPVPQPPPDVSRASVTLISVLNELAEIRRRAG
jgi:peptidyl serine alpha-galactosyltransferase